MIFKLVCAKTGAFSDMHGFFKSPPTVYLTNFKGSSVDRWIGCYHCCVECHSRAFEISHTKTAEAIINSSSFHLQNPQMLDQFNFRPLVLPYMTCGSSSDFLLIKGKLAMYWIYLDYFKDCRFVNILFIQLVIIIGTARSLMHEPNM